VWYKNVVPGLKRDWTMDDYPIRVRFRPVPQVSNTSRMKSLPWTADIINWPGMSGSADTRQGALEELRKNFDRSKATRPTLPRPGTKVPIEFASNELVGQHADLAKDFVKRVLGVDWAWISDDSSLWDFHGEETNESLIKKIRDVYGVDVSDISSGNLAKIFDRILESKTAPPTPDQRPHLN